MPALISNLSDTFVVPSPEDVRAGVGFGIDGTQFTGTLSLPPEAYVADGIGYGAGGVEFVGALDVNYPEEDFVIAGVVYGGGAFTGTVTLPAEDDVRFAVKYGANGTQYSGSLIVGGSGVAVDSTDRFATAKAWITQQRATHLARTVVYKRGASAVSVSATVTTSTFDEVDSYGVVHRVEYRDFIFPYQGFTPMAGDRIVETVGDRDLVYVVSCPGGGQCYSEIADRTALRVHTLLAGEA